MEHVSAAAVVLETKRNKSRFVTVVISHLISAPRGKKYSAPMVQLMITTSV